MKCKYFTTNDTAVKDEIKSHAKLFIKYSLCVKRHQHLPMEVLQRYNVYFVNWLFSCFSP